jgi:hypothetical protein
MAMRLGLLSLSDANITRVLKKPPLAWDLVTPPAPAPAPAPEAEEDPPKSKRKKTAAARPSKAKAPATPELATNEGMRCDLEKSWHGIHYLLTGTAWEGTPPLDFLVEGGRQVGQIDSEHGPLRAFNNEEVRAIYDAISVMGPYELRKRFNPRDMAAKEIYPDIWTKTPNEEESLRYLLDNLDRLRGYLRETLDSGFGVIVFLV